MEPARDGESRPSLDSIDSGPWDDVEAITARRSVPRLELHSASWESIPPDELIPSVPPPAHVDSMVVAKSGDGGAVGIALADLERSFGLVPPAADDGSGVRAREETGEPIEANDAGEASARGSRESAAATSFEPAIESVNFRRGIFPVRSTLIDRKSVV